MSQNYVAPMLADSFTCPHCGALAHQTWFKTYLHAYKRDSFPIDIDQARDDLDEWIETSRNFDAESRAIF